MRHSRRYDFQGHPRSESRSGDDLDPLSGPFSFFVTYVIVYCIASIQRCVGWLDRDADAARCPGVSSAWKSDEMCGVDSEAAAGVDELQTPGDDEHWDENSNGSGCSCWNDAAYATSEVKSSTGPRQIKKLSYERNSDKKAVLSHR